MGLGRIACGIFFRSRLSGRETAPPVWGKREPVAGVAAAAATMLSGFAFPTLPAAQIAEALTKYGIAPVANLRPDDIAKPLPDLLPAVLSRFIALYVDAPG